MDIAWWLVIGVVLGAVVTAGGVWLGQRSAGSMVDTGGRGGVMGSDIAPTAGYLASEVEDA